MKKLENVSLMSYHRGYCTNSVLRLLIQHASAADGGWEVMVQMKWPEAMAGNRDFQSGVCTLCGQRIVAVYVKVADSVRELASEAS